MNIIDINRQLVKKQIQNATQRVGIIAIRSDAENYILLDANDHSNLGEEGEELWSIDSVLEYCKSLYESHYTGIFVC